ncbi:hypothetical protein FOCC_FOCC017791, partial [Frankliniella occidentalis]
MSLFTTHHTIPMGHGCRDTASGSTFASFLGVIVSVINARLDREHLQAQQARLRSQDHDEEYDFVVVGGGTAGCVLAARLSQEPGVSVLLLERGGTEPPEARVPGFLTYVLMGNTAEYIKAVAEAMEAAGVPYRHDVNGESQLGHSFVQTSTRDGERWSTYRSYLLPALGRPNLFVETFAKATRVLFEQLDKAKPTAVGVEYRNAAGQVRVVRARKEVVLTAGAIHSPQILQLSGIGPAEQL